MIYRFNTTPVKVPENNFVHINKLIPKFIWRSKRCRIANIILEKKNKERGLIYHLTLTLTIKLPFLRKCDFGGRIDTWVNGT